MYLTGVLKFFKIFYKNFPKTPLLLFPKGIYFTCKLIRNEFYGGTKNDKAEKRTGKENLRGWNI